MQKIFYKTIDTYNPTISPSQTQDNILSVLGGKNYRWVNDSLVSGWGNDLFYSNKFGFNSYIFKIEGVGVFVFSCNGEVVELKDNCKAKVVYNFPKSNYGTPYPWSHIEFNCYHYFVNPCINGIVRYDGFTKTWTTLNAKEEFGIDGLIYSILFHESRVWILAEDTVNASVAIGAPDDENSGGLPSFTNFSEEAGAIIWTLKDGGGGKPYGLYKSYNVVYCFLSTGIIKFQKIGNELYHMLWEHEHYSALNQWCVIQQDKNNILFLGQRGINTLGENSRGTSSSSQSFNDFCSTYLVDHILRYYSVDLSYEIKLWSSPYTDEVFISHGYNEQFGYYKTSLVIHSKLEKISSFDIKHKQFVPVDFDELEFGFIGHDNKLRKFDNSSNNVSGANECSPIYEPLNSFVYLGTIKPQQQVDELTRHITLNNILIHHKSLIANYNLLNLEETNYEDYYKNDNNFNLLVYSSVDSKSLDTDSYQTAIPIISDAYATTYDTYVKGINFILKVQATELNQYYAINAIGIDYEFGGVR